MGNRLWARALRRARASGAWGKPVDGLFMIIHEILFNYNNLVPPELWMDAA
jgi:hypothetical protein